VDERKEAWFVTAAKELLAELPSHKRQSLPGWSSRARVLCVFARIDLLQEQRKDGKRMAKSKCETCDGCGKVVEDEGGTIPYSEILEMAKNPRCNMTFYLAIHPPKLCPACGGCGEYEKIELKRKASGFKVRLSRGEEGCVPIAADVPQHERVLVSVVVDGIFRGCIWLLEDELERLELGEGEYREVDFFPTDCSETEAEKKGGE